MTARSDDEGFSRAGKLNESPPNEQGISRGPLDVTSGDQLQIQVLKEAKLQLLEKKKRYLTGLPHRNGFKKYKWQEDFFYCYEKDLFLTAANQVGKAVLNNQVIYTPQGKKTIGELRVNDEVFGRYGLPTKVLAVHKVTQKPFYKIKFNDGTEVVACGEHRWIAKDGERRFRKLYKKGDKQWENPEYGKWAVYTTEDIIKIGGYSPKAKSNYSKFSIPVCEEVFYKIKELPIDPYFLGVILGDGSISTGNGSISKKDKQISDFLIKQGCKKTSRKFKHSISKDVLKKLEDLKLKGTKSHTKFIPEDYFESAIAQRKQLLAGLLDTDGTVTEKGYVEYNTASPQLAKDVQRLVCSLGGLAEIRERESFYRNKDGKLIQCKNSFRIHIKTLFNPFILERKAKRFKPVKKYKHERVIDSIELIGNRDGTCIMVDNLDSSYLIGEEFFVTHNSTIQIATAIEWCGNVDLWPRLWGPNSVPRQMWYLYPSLDFADDEFENKWIPDLLPKEIMMDDPQWGWKVEKRKSQVYAIHFNSGASIYFKAYSQSAEKLQGSTIFAIFCDEELPEELWDELNLRRSAKKGYFRMSFTATLGQEIWFDTMERKGTDKEKFPQAKKIQVSLYDCMHFSDGTPSHIDEEYINKVISFCKNEAEVQKRVMGRFAVDEGLRYAAFSRENNVSPSTEIPASWPIYIGVDVGSGGDGHPSAISMVAVSQDYTSAYVFNGWRGAPGVLTTDEDVFNKLNSMIEEGNYLDRIAAIFYDYSAASFGTICQRKGLAVQRADKSRDLGESILNVLFKNKRLKIFDSVELFPLVQELMTLKISASKTKAKDDFIDSLRYALSRVPFDWEKIGAKLTQPLRFQPDILNAKDQMEKDRREFTKKSLIEGKKQAVLDVDTEIDFWGGYFDGF